MIATLKHGPHDGVTFNAGEVETAVEAPTIIAIDEHVYEFADIEHTKHAARATYEYRGEA